MYICIIGFCLLLTEHAICTFCRKIITLKAMTHDGQKWPILSADIVGPQKSVACHECQPTFDG